MSSSQSRPASFVKDSHRTMGEELQPWQSPNQPSWNTARFVLRIISFIIAILLLGLSISGFMAPMGFGSFPVMGTPLSAAAFSYDIAQFIVMCARKRKTGIRPAVSLGFELVLSMGGLALSILMIIFTVDSWQWHIYYSGVPDDGLTPPIPNYVSNGYLWFGMSVTGSIVAVILSLIHFVFFVRDCVEVDRERKAAKKLRKERMSTGAAHVREPVHDVPASSYEGIELDSYEDITKSDLVRPSNETSPSMIIS
ncbi:hypothetical protein F5Y06DRAFT_306570 [Hypoxylon sp. FL0890]|nr:hypothetical protein F5Y06DRAFT_306570 [Hypoxylon sp. FL0890]